MGNYLSVPVLLLAAALQSSIVPFMRIGDGQPDFVLLLILAWSVNASIDEGVIWAFSGGVMQDLLSRAPTGASITGMVILVFAIGGLGRQVYRIGFLMLVGLVVFGTLIKQTGFMLVITLAGFQLDWVAGLQNVVLPTLFYNLIFIWPVYWLVRRIQRRLGGYEQALR
jgi:rod shape-determining protein MreD